MRTRTTALLLLPTGLLAASCGHDTRAVDPHEPAPTTLAVDDLDNHLPCGFGFTLADDDGTRMLRIYLSDHRADVPRTMELPAEGWTAETEFGEHLRANWCTDVIVEPHRDVQETWSVVEGTLTFAGDPPPSDPGRPVDARAEVTGLVVESPDGERVELGDVELHNEQWGFLAG